MITTEIKDDRIAQNLVSVTRTKVSPDLTMLHAWLSIVGDESAQRGLMGVVQRASPFLRRRLGEELQLRVVPTLKLHLDEGPNHAARVEALLDAIHEERSLRGDAGEDASPECEPTEDPSGGDGGEVGEDP